MHRPADELRAGLDHVRLSPPDQGPLELIVRRPAPAAREVLPERTAGPHRRPGRRDLEPHPGMQLTLMNSRANALIAGADKARWPRGRPALRRSRPERDQPPLGARLALGGAVVEISDQPHTGCQQFTQRFGLDAMRLVNSPEGRNLRLRGVNAPVIDGGTVRVGDAVAVRTRWREAPATA